MAQDEILQVQAYCMWTLNRALEIFEGCGILLSRGNAREASHMIQQHLHAYQRLAVDHGLSCRMFRMRPKSHFLLHTGIQVKSWRINPTCFHCFDEESWLGRCKRIGVQCHGKTMTTRVLQRYLICLALYFENFRRTHHEIGWRSSFIWYIKNVIEKSGLYPLNFTMVFFLGNHFAFQYCRKYFWGNHLNTRCGWTWALVLFSATCTQWQQHTASHGKKAVKRATYKHENVL